MKFSHRIALTLCLLCALVGVAKADTLQLSAGAGRFDSPSALAREPYFARFNGPSNVTVYTLNPTTLDSNNPLGSIQYAYQPTSVGYFDLNPGQSATINLGQIFRITTGVPGSITYNLPFDFSMPSLTLNALDPANKITGTLPPSNTNILLGGNITTSGISSGGGYVDSGDNINTMRGSLSYAFPQEFITVTFNPATWVNNILVVSATITRNNPASEVPEPLTLLLVGSGLAGIVLRNRRKIVKI